MRNSAGEAVHSVPVAAAALPCPKSTATPLLGAPAPAKAPAPAVVPVPAEVPVLLAAPAPAPVPIVSPPEVVMKPWLMPSWPVWVEDTLPPGPEVALEEAEMEPEEEGGGHPFLVVMDFHFEDFRTL